MVFSMFLQKIVSHVTISRRTVAHSIDICSLKMLNCFVQFFFFFCFLSVRLSVFEDISVCVCIWNEKETHEMMYEFEFSSAKKRQQHFMPWKTFAIC